MNVRINELFKQAYGFPIDKLATINLEKFAELIVQECAELCSDPVVVLQHWGIDSESESVL